MRGFVDRILVVCAGLAGCLGVALAAMAAHAAGGGNLETASKFLLLHAPALLALGALAGAGLVHGCAARAAGLALILGLALFCGDLSVRAIWGIAPFRLAAPTGGFILMAGWLAAALSALLPRRAPPC